MKPLDFNRKHELKPIMLALAIIVCFIASMAILYHMEDRCAENKAENSQPSNVWAYIVWEKEPLVDCDCSLITYPFEDNYLHQYPEYVWKEREGSPFIHHLLPGHTTLYIRL